MLAIYNAEKGLKLYGDEVFCMAAGPVGIARNLLTNSDLRYGTEFWDAGANTKLSIVSGRLSIENTATAQGSASRTEAVVPGVGYFLRFNIDADVFGFNVRVWDSVAKTTELGSLLTLKTEGAYGLTFTATTEVAYVEVVLLSTTSGYSMRMHGFILAEYEPKGIPWVNLLPNSFFDIDVSGWTAGSTAVLTHSGGNMSMAHTAYGVAYTTITPIANAFYKFQFKFIDVAAANGRIYVGFSSLNNGWGEYGELSADHEGYIVFRPTTTATVYLTVNTSSSNASDVTRWDNLVAYRSNDILVDGRFAKKNTFWFGDDWTATISSGKATITGSKGSQISQQQDDVLTVGASYLYTFRLTIPSESLIVRVHNVLLDTELVSVEYTASGRYTLPFVAEDTDVRLTFESGATSAALEVTGVRGVLAQQNPAGDWSAIEGEVVYVGSESNTDTGVLASIGQTNWGKAVPIKDNLAVAVNPSQNVGTGDWTYSGWGSYRGLVSGGVSLFTKRNDAPSGYDGEPAIEGVLTSDGRVQFRVSDDGMASADTIISTNAVARGSFYWELVREGSVIKLRINSVQVASSVTLVNAVASLDNINGYNYTGPYSAAVWESQVSAADNDWFDVTYGNGLFVAVAGTGTLNRVMTSPDGIAWTSQVTPVDNLWRSVAFGGGLFVAVSSTGTGDRVMTSPDGVTWTSRTSSIDNDWHSVTYGVASGQGTFVAVAITGTSNRVMTSTNGVAWTTRTSAADNDWFDVTFGASLFVAVAGSGTGDRVMTSPDGTTWTIRTSAADNTWADVAFGGSTFVAVSITGTGNRVMTSFDGVNWTSRTSASDNDWRGVVYGNGTFVAVASTGTGNRIMTSADGITWADQVTLGANLWRSIAYGAGVFVAVASSGTDSRAMTAYDYLVSGRIVGGYGGSSMVRFIPSAVTRSRSRATYQSEKHLFNLDQKYTQVGEANTLLIEAPTTRDSDNQLIGNTFIPDNGERQETTVLRLNSVLSAASKELDYFEAIEFKAFFESVVRGGEFTYDPYALSGDNLIDPSQVFLNQKSFRPSRINKLEYFMYSWTMRVRGSL